MQGESSAPSGGEKDKCTVRRVKNNLGKPTLYGLVFHFHKSGEYLAGFG